MAKMRMHCRLSFKMLALIWGVYPTTVGKNINEYINKWGEAGEHLSYLDIDKDYLDKTCPQKYKDEGLHQVCAVPDGKDFMIWTPRQNTLFTRACYSDKVHHSKVQTTSWSTLLGLRFEHTPLFLARAPEKLLLSYGIQD